MAEATMEDILLALNGVLCIYYLVQFHNNEVWALIDSGSKDNIIISTYIVKLGLKVSHTNVQTQKIDSSILEIFEIVLANF